VSSVGEDFTKPVVVGKDVETQKTPPLDRGTHRELIRQAASSFKFRTPLEYCTHHSKECNRSCGDEIAVSVEVRSGSIAALYAKVDGCLVTSAAWTLLADRLIEHSVAIAIETLEIYLQFLDGKRPANDEGLNKQLQLLSIFQRPSARKDCARLPALAFLRALSCEKIN
jgi:nitrogen fixation NifU-like protein